MSRFLSFSSRRGFTLVELLVVILIIAILIAVAAPSFLKQQTKAHDSSAQQVLAVSYKEARLAYLEKDKYLSAPEIVQELNNSEPQYQYQEGTATTGTIHGDEAGEKLISVYRVNPADGTPLDDSRIILCTASEKDRVFCIGSDQGQGWDVVSAYQSGTTMAFAAGPLHPEKSWSRADNSKQGTIAILNGLGVSKFPGYTGSGPAAPITAPENTDNPITTGNTTVGNTLTGTKGTWTAKGPITYSYQWKTCDSDGNACQDIAGATAETLVMTNDLVGKTIRFGVTASSGGVSATEDTSATQVVGASKPTNSVLPGVASNTTPAVGNTLNALRGIWTVGDLTAELTYTYQWQSCNDESDCENINGATGEQLLLTNELLDKKVAVIVTATNRNASLSKRSALSAPVVRAAPVNTAIPVVSGTARVGATIHGSQGTWTSESGMTYSYLWLLCDNNGNSCQGAGAETSPDLFLSSGTTGVTYRVQVRATNVQGGQSTAATSAASPVIQPALPIAPSNNTLPSISGDTSISSTLTANSGTWTPSPTSYNYQWQSCTSASTSTCSDLAGKTEQTLALISAYNGLRVRVQVSGVNAGGAGAGVYSPVSAVIAPAAVGTTFSSYGDTNGVFYWIGTNGKTTGFVNPVTGSTPKVAGSMSSFLNGWDITNATNRADGAPSHTDSSPTAFLRWDFKARRIQPGRITIKQRPDSPLHNFTSYTVEATNSTPSTGYVASEWTNIGNATAAAGQNAWNSANLSAATGYRYIQIRQTSADTGGYNYFAVGEVEFYGSIFE